MNICVKGSGWNLNIETYLCQHSQIIVATKGSTSFGMSRRRFWKPTAPTTCIGFIPLQGNLKVASSQRIMPKLYTSHLKNKHENKFSNFSRYKGQHKIQDYFDKELEIWGAISSNHDKAMGIGTTECKKREIE